VLVAWYCPAKGMKIDITSAAKAKENVTKTCLNEADPKSKLGNKCFNDLALKKHKAYRKTHFSDKA